MHRQPTDTLPPSGRSVATLWAVGKDVIHISFSSSGGAGRVATQLVESQRELGWSAQLITLTQSNLFESPFALPRHTASAAIDNLVLRKQSFPSLLSLVRDTLSSSVARNIQASAVLHFHWINGVINLEDFAAAKPTQPVVWTLHDMNPFTGTCHQSLGCAGFRQSCHTCPAVRPFARAAVAKNLQKKIAAVSQIPRLKVVAPSPWMVDLAQSSSVFRNTPVELIPNPIRDEFLETITPGDPPSQGLFFTVVATDLSDPLKNIPFLLSAFREFRKTHDAVSLHLVGSKGQKFSQEDGVIYRGALDSRSLRHQLESSIALLVPSVAENAPLVIAEAAALGIPAVVNEVDSLVGMVSWLGFGRVARTPAQWSEALGSLVQELPKNLHRSTANRLEKIARELFDPKVVARQYVKLYESMQ